MANFPDTIYTPRETENLPGIVYDPTQKTNMFSEDFQNLGNEINVIEQNLSLKNGWIPVFQTWSYASSITITVPTGAALLYQKGDKIKFTQHGVIKYFYILNVIDTVLTVSAGSSYTVENTSTYPITDIYLSHQENPIGFPGSFPLSAPTWSSSISNFTNQPTTNSFFFYMKGGVVTIKGVSHMDFSGTGTGIFSALFSSNQIPLLQDNVGVAQNPSSGAILVSYTMNSQAYKVRLASVSGSTPAVNGEWIQFQINILI